MKVEDCFAHVGGDPFATAFPPAPSGPPGHGHGAGGAADTVTAPFAEWGPAAFADRIDEPLALYVHVPFCRRPCNFCPFYKNRTEAGFSAHYRDLVVAEIEATAAALGPARDKRAAGVIYFGGGTPSDLATNDLTAILQALQRHFRLTDDAEITVEGRVRGLTAAKAQAWTAAGVNRFSLGLQSTDEGLRRSLGRLAGRDEIAEVLGHGHAAGAVMIVDLIHGLPGQSAALMADDIRFLATATDIAGLDLYALRQFPDSALARSLASGKSAPLPSLADHAAIYRAALQALETYGFKHFTLQHWRRQGSERSRYNQSAKRGDDILAFGSAAGGRLGNIGWMQAPDLDAYADAIASGKKPVLAARRHHPPGESESFLNTLTQAIEALTLPANDVWPAFTDPWRTPLLANWEAAGLLSPAPSDSAVPQALTAAGTFWAPRLTAHLRKLVTSAAPTPAPHHATR